MHKFVDYRWLATQFIYLAHPDKRGLGANAVESGGLGIGANSVAPDFSGSAMATARRYAVVRTIDAMAAAISCSNPVRRGRYPADVAPTAALSINEDGCLTVEALYGDGAAPWVQRLARCAKRNGVDQAGYV